ncbi:MAG: flavodoxin-dependent (E)-4-hydroxy-3-methylbut-2-enyl-diphosphate synthase [Thermosulfidibacteraceae bacterium]
MRRKTRTIKLGNLLIGGNNPIWVQSMIKCYSEDVESVTKEIKRLKRAGCEIVRIAIPTDEAAELIPLYKKECGEKIPLVADIHFSYKLALKSIEKGADGIRINPGNINNKSWIREIIKTASIYHTCIRIGINAGSLEKRILAKYGGPTPEALAESALYWTSFFLDEGFDNIKMSIKASDVDTTVRAYRIYAEKTDIPLHIGITEAGFDTYGIIKSSIGIGLLLYEGIGDTVRVSLSEPSNREVEVCYEILQALGIRKTFPEIISCPTCGRKKIDVIKLARTVKKNLKQFRKYLKIAIMGCEVNGPGEAKEADYGIAGGKTSSLIFSKGKILKKVPNEKAIDELIKTIKEVEQWEE